MKNIRIIIVSLLFIPFGLLAQEQQQNCISTISSEQYKLSIKQSKKRNFTHQENTTFSIKLKPHIIRRSNGTGGLSQPELLASLTQLAGMYTPLGITFDFCEASFIDNDKLFEELIIFSSEEIKMGTQYRDPTALNVFFAPNAAGRCNVITPDCPGTFELNWAYFPSSENEWVVMNNNFATQDLTLSHEVGHFFNLFHTNQFNSAERVVRKGNNANCDSVGDLLCDTYAAPTLSPNAPFSNVNEKCQYIGTETDPIGEPYNSIQFGVSPQVNNIMTTGFRDATLECRTNFTLGQINRMKISIANDYGHLSNSCEDTCLDTIVITQDVLPGNTDIQSARQTITARNTISNHAVANYAAGIEITLTQDFDAVFGSSFDIAINNNCDNSSQILDLANVQQSFKQKASNKANTFDFTITPNPSKDVITITNLKKGALIITNIKGATILHKKIETTDINLLIDINNFSKGFYVIRHQDHTGNIVTKKLIKK